MTRRGALFIEVDITDEDVRRGRLLTVAWIFQSRLNVWHDGEVHPAQLRADAANAALVIGFDLHRSITSHVANRLGVHLGWPCVDLRIVTGLLPAELAAQFPLPDGVELHGIVRRLATVRMAWTWLRSHR